MLAAAAGSYTWSASSTEPLSDRLLDLDTADADSACRGEVA